jgi:hypothetical protein
MQEEATHLLGQFQHKHIFHMANQGIKIMHRLQYFKSDCQAEEIADEENETIFEIDKSKGHQNRRKTQKSKSKYVRNCTSSRIISTTHFMKQN